MDKHSFKLENSNSSEVGICVVKRRNENINDLIRRFKKKYSKSGLNKEAKDLMSYDKPSLKRRKKRAAAERIRIREAQKKQTFKTRKGI